jgi:hypothetical protein
VDGVEILILSNRKIKQSSHCCGGGKHWIDRDYAMEWVMESEKERGGAESVRLRSSNISAKRQLSEVSADGCDGP